MSISEEVKAVIIPATPGPGNNKNRRNKNKNREGNAANTNSFPRVQTKEQLDQERKDKKVQQNEWVKNKKEEGIKSINEGHARAVPTLCKETEDGVALMTQNDYFMQKVRSTMALPNGLDGELALELMRDNETIYYLFHMMNAKLANAVGARYTPPRSYRGAPRNPAPRIVFDEPFVALHAVENPIQVEEKAPITKVAKV